MEVGTELIAISNTSANPIADGFDGYAEGSVVALGWGNTAEVNYIGGDGSVSP